MLLYQSMTFTPLEMIDWLNIASWYCQPALPVRTFIQVIGFGPIAARISATYWSERARLPAENPTSFVPSATTQLTAGSFHSGSEARIR